MPSDKDLFRLLLANSPGAVAMLDRDMRYLAVSRRWLEDYHLGDRSLAGLSHYEVFPEIPERWKEIHRRCLGGATEQCPEEAFPRADGTVDWIRWKVVPWRRETGEVGGIFIFSEVITARKEIETFAFSLAHDLKAPLRAIDGFSRALQKDSGPKLGPEGRKLLGRVCANVQSMNRLVDGLVTFCRLGETGLEAGRVDMTKLFKSVAEEAVSAEPGRGVRLKVARLPPAHGDLLLLRQAVGNLLANALKFTAASRDPRIEVGGKAGNSEVTYWVKDNGAGFDMASADKLFGLFQRLHHRADFDGSGIGLASVKRIILRHHGRVWAEGRPGEGAAFYFSLPRAPEGA